MTHYLPAMVIAWEEKLSLFFIFMLPLFTINANNSNQQLIFYQCLPEEVSKIELAHLYFDDVLEVKTFTINNLEDELFTEQTSGKYSNLIAMLENLQNLSEGDSSIRTDIDFLTSRLRVDLFLLNQVCNKEALSTYVIDYAFLDRKSHYYSIKLDWVQNSFDNGLLSENELISFYKVVLHFLEQFYDSGLMNAYRKNQQTERYRLLEKMLEYLAETDTIHKYKSVIDQIFAVSKKGEVLINRHFLTHSNIYSSVIAELLEMIEPIEISYYQSFSIATFLKLHTKKNKLRDKYLKVVKLADRTSETFEKSNYTAESTTLAFFAGNDYIYQYAFNSDNNFQLIQHPRETFNANVTQTIEEMDHALFQFDGSRGAMNRIKNQLKSMSSKVIDPLEIQLFSTIRIVADGQLCLFPFEMLIGEDGRHMFEDHHILYQFDLKDFEAEIKPEDIYMIRGKFKGRLELTESTNSDTNWSLEEFKSAATPNSLLHLGTHQIFSENQPLILLNQSDTITRSEWFNTPDIMGVLMSMCAGFRGSLTSGENARSFGNRAYEAGAENVISSLWSVDDHATGRLIEYYFENLKAGMTSSQSLRQAKLKYLAETDSFHKHPVFWAAFIHYGNDYKVAKQFNYLYLLICLLPALILRFKIRVRY